MAAVGPKPAAQEIPDKLYFRIGEVSRLAGLKPYVLRYWETEFPTISPKKSGTGHRLYRRKDVETVLEIKRLLYEKRYTIEGARKALDPKAKPAAARPAPAARNQADLFGSTPDLSTIRAGLQDILEILK
jgi:DNA-binding transcriptional MerR regulator